LLKCSGNLDFRSEALRWAEQNKENETQRHRKHREEKPFFSKGKPEKMGYARERCKVKIVSLWMSVVQTPCGDTFRFADKPLVAPLPKEIAAFLLDCR
jgi:hypothetical protein